MLRAKLVVVGGDAKAAEIPLKLPTIIGRGRDVNLTLPHPLVSRQHCELFENNGQLLVRDLKSLNGTYVDNRRIHEPEILRTHQLLTIGNVTFRAIYMNQQAAEDGETEMQANADTEFADASKSTIDLNDVAPADAGSQVDPLNEEDSIHSRPTVPGKRDSQSSSLNETVSDSTGNRCDGHGISSVTSEDGPQEATVGPQHSVCSALMNAGLANGPADATLSEIQRQLPDSNVAQASKIEEITLHENDADASKVGQSFTGIESENENGNVNPEESALGSFIRKLPR